MWSKPCHNASNFHMIISFDKVTHKSSPLLRVPITCSCRSNQGLWSASPMAMWQARFASKFRACTFQAKLKNFACRSCLNLLSVRANLVRGKSMIKPISELCNLGSETIPHAFLTCEKAQTIWGIGEHSCFQTKQAHQDFTMLVWDKIENNENPLLFVVT